MSSLQDDINKILCRTRTVVNRDNGKTSSMSLIQQSFTAPDGTKIVHVIDHGGDFEAERETALKLSRGQSTTSSIKYTLKDVVNKYIQSKMESGSINEKTLESYTNTLDLLIECFGKDFEPNNIKLIKAENFRNILMKLPPNRKKQIKLKGLSLQEIVNLQLAPQSATTVKGCIERCSTFFDWAVKADFVDKNYFHKMNVPMKKQKESASRDRWNNEDLKKLFSSDIYILN